MLLLIFLYGKISTNLFSTMEQCTATLCARGWCDWKSKYLSVCVLCRNTVVVRKPSLWCVILVSRNGSVVCLFFNCELNGRFNGVQMGMKVLDLFPKECRQGVVHISFPKGGRDLVCGQCSILHTFITRLATVTDTGESIAVPYTPYTHTHHTYFLVQ